MKKRVVSILLCVAMTAAMVAGCGSSSDGGSSSDSGEDSGSGDVITVGFSQVGAESDWRTANTESMQETFTEENGYELIFDDAQQKQENQITAIRNFIQQEVDYILLAPVTESGWDTVLQEAYDADIPVIIVDRMVDVSNDDLYTTWIGTDSLLEGRKAAEWLNAYATAKGWDASELNIAHIQGTMGSTAQIGRTQGLEEGVEKYGWNLVAQQCGEFTQAKGQEVMESMLKQYDNINVVYCENDNEAFGAIDAIEAAGKTVGTDIANGEILVLSFDTTNAGLTDTLEGKIVCDVECNPLHGPRAEELIKALEAGEEVEKLNYVDEEIFAYDDTVASVTATNSLDEEGDYAVTVITQEIIDGRAY
ncbi:ABC transporter substrate-binding protein [Faecalicatena contorta]|uniref:ABC transporter substrate-binding protein n=1 Tax=Faecalicatena fissicatena TaxID=290055 RepID=A0ABS2EAF1_9FIRM|nr:MULTISPECIES: ABC transporter substrate-binding protein [Clostridia]MBM6685833.1 ABC transporter substrate-binding protein [Faecalicatena contorta]MBM6711363.1 ABC transporter substrate-binding protein [Faecalicatena contorta]MBM6738605.1 ABC transporter substrate-binding protein [Faecalicatena fissicatena]HIY00174.1 ABC transporter substrate-binding protein [Candidatus Dorea intestinigallinarum]